MFGEIEIKEEKEEEKSRPMTIEEKQGAFAIIGIIATICGFILMSTPFFPDPVDTSNAVAVFGLCLALIGYTFFIFGLLYPYLESYKRKSR